MTFDFFETKKMLSVCLCLCLEHTVLDGILEKHQCHWHQSWTLVVVLELCLHESLEVGQITEIFVHPELIQEITCKSIKTMNNMKKTHQHLFITIGKPRTKYRWLLVGADAMESEVKE